MQSVTASDSTFDGFTGAWRGEEAAGSKPVAAITRFDLRRAWHRTNTVPSPASLAAVIGYGI